MKIYLSSLKNGYTIRVDNSVQIELSPRGWRSTLKEKTGCKFFPTRIDHFSQNGPELKSKKKSQNLSPLSKNGRKLAVYLKLAYNSIPPQPMTIAEIQNINREVANRCHTLGPPSKAQLDARPTGDQEVAGSTPAGSETFDHEIFSTAILSLPLIQEGQLSVSGERIVYNTG